MGAFGQTTISPGHTVKTHGAPGKGLYLAMFLFLPCVIGGCCIGRMFFTPKQGLYYPEPFLFAQEPYDLSNPAGQSFDSRAGPPGVRRSNSEQVWQPPPRKPSERVSRSAHNLFDAEQRETPGQPIFDYRDTPD